MTRTRTRRRWSRRMITLLFVLGLVATLLPVTAAPALADHTGYTPPSNNIALRIEGCNNSSSLVAVGGPCEDPDFGAPGDDDYTTGNLGKSWNELDLVPHRLITTNDESTTQTYNVVIAADYLDAGFIGYDIMSDPVRDTDTAGGSNVSDTSCVVSTVHDGNDGPTGGGADVTIYRILEITQDAGTTCVFDYWIRLSLEASDYNGSNLQSYKFEQVSPSTGTPTDFSVGKATISIPTKDVEPVEITKDMTATQGADNVWNLTKGATPTEYDFGCTCEDGNEDPSTTVSVTVNWSVIEVQGDVKVVTNVTANNTAARPLVFTPISDELFDLPLFDADPSPSGEDFIIDPAANSLGFGTPEEPLVAVEVPGKTNQLLATFTFDVDVDSNLVGTTWSNEATASVYDPFVQQELGTITAISEATITQGTETNSTAVITDVESISDSGGRLSYSVDSAVGASGTFQSYTPGTETQADVTWVSDSQSADGSVTFNKTVYLDGPAIVTDGKLSDTASLLASDGFEPADATAMTTFTSEAKVDLTINKTITGGVLADGQSETFLFDVSDGVTTIEDVAVTIIGPATSGSATVGGLKPGVEYTVSEQDKAYWTEEGPKTITINLPNCDDSLTFDNTFAPDLDVTKTAVASYTERHDWDVEKTVNPLEQSGFPTDVLPWTWTINVTETVVDKDFSVTGQIDVYNPMPYTVTATVTDTLNDGTSVTVDCDPGTSVTVAPNTTESCSYSAIPDDASATLNTATARTFGVDFTGEKVVSFVKSVENDSATVSDTEIGLTDADAGGAPFTGNDKHVCSTERATYGEDWTYGDVITNTAKLTDLEGTLYQSSATTEWECTAGFVNIYKTTNGQVDPTKDIKFDLYSGTTVLETVSTSNDADGILEFQTALVPGDTYTICESPVPAGYTFEITVNGGNVLTYAGPPGAQNPTGEIQCFDFTAVDQQTLTFNVNNSFPGGAPRTPGYWKNWNTCTGGNQEQTAEHLGGTAEGVFLLDDLLPQLVGDLYIDPEEYGDERACEIGVAVLDSRDINSDKKQGNDAAYTLARSYLAALLNQDAGACDPDGVTFDLSDYGLGTEMTFQEVLNEAQALLDAQDFTGTGKYLTPKDKSGDRELALALYGIIDDYNNSELCTGDESH